jgi:putative transcriptional regulator
MAGELRVEAGTLLAAFPDMLDPNFMHSVVLICQHSEQGAYGVVTNRATKLAVKTLLPDHALLGKSEFPVFLGGPVDHTTLQFLHLVPEDVPGGLSIDGKLWLGGDLDALGEYLAKHPRIARRKVRMFLGYAGWSAGQLDTELGTGSRRRRPGDGRDLASRARPPGAGSCAPSAARTSLGSSRRRAGIERIARARADERRRAAPGPAFPRVPRQGAARVPGVRARRGGRDRAAPAAGPRTRARPDARALVRRSLRRPPRARRRVAGLLLRPAASSA